MLPGLDTDEFSHLYHALDDEVNRTRIGGAAKVAFRLLEVVSYSLPLALSFVYLLDAIGPRLGPGMHALVDSASARLGGLVLPLMAAVVALFLANLPLFRKAFRQWRLSRRLLTLRLLDYAMLPPPRFRRKRLVLLVPIGFLMLFLYGFLAAPTEPLGRRVVALALLVGWPGALFLTDGLLRRLRGRLEYFEEVHFLRSELVRGTSTEGEPTLSPTLLIRIADVERSRFLRGSAAAISHRSSEEANSYAVSKSDGVATTLRTFDDDERLRIESAIEDLASWQEGALAATKSGPPSVLHVNDSEWQLVYEVEATTRTIHILAIRHQKEHT